MKKLFNGILLGLLITSLLVGPVMAAVYYAYLTVEETSGNDYSDLAVNCSRNITQLVEYGLMTSTGLDTRVLTGGGSPLPHMLAEDRIMFVTDLAAYEERTLIFYLGATSLSAFPIIVGYNGSFTTPDDPDLELGYVMELLIDGYFNAGADYVGDNILYKPNAFRVWINAANSLRVAALNASGAEQWAMNYSAFSTGEHTVYIVANGVGALLYVDDFVTAKDTENLFSTNVWELSATKDARMDFGNDYLPGGYARTFYAHDMYWAFYTKSGDNTNFYYKTSTDGDSWSGEYSINASVSTSIYVWGIWLDDSGNVHFVYPDYSFAGTDYVKYRRGVPQSNSTITWDTDWQVVITRSNVGQEVERAQVVVDPAGYPTIMYYMGQSQSDYRSYITKSTTNNGTFTHAGYQKTIVTLASEHRSWLVQYSNSTEMYVLYTSSSAGDEYHIRGCYYNGSVWAGTDDYVFQGDIHEFYSQVRGVTDDSDNLYTAYCRGTSWPGWYLRIRYSTGTWGDPIQINSELTSLSMTYDEGRDFIYVFYLSGATVYCMGLNIEESELTSAYALGNLPSTNSGISSSPYTNQTGILYSTLSGAAQSSTGHVYLQFLWQWNDNANDWIWMANNTMPYADEFQMAVDGTLQLHYEPAAIIEGTTLPDEQSDHDGNITWGGNPPGVTASLGVFAPEDEEESLYPTVPLPGTTAPQDILGPTGQPGWTAEMEALTAHPLYPLVSGVSTFATLLGMSLPIPLVWIIGATLILFFIIVLVLRGTERGQGEGYRKPMHQILAALAGGGWVAYCYSLGIYSFWVPVIFAVLAIAIIVGERSPTVS